MKRETVALLEKARLAIKSAQNIMEDGDFDFAASRAWTVTPCGICFSLASPHMEP